jgi:hypothetical protein
MKAATLVVTVAERDEGATIFRAASEDRRRLAARPPSSHSSPRSSGIPVVMGAEPNPDQPHQQPKSIAYTAPQQPRSRIFAAIKSL